jgi:hypothetical protein
VAKDKNCPWFERKTLKQKPLKTTCGGQTEKKKDLISDNLF